MAWEGMGVGGGTWKCVESPLCPPCSYLHLHFSQVGHCRSLDSGTSGLQLLEDCISERAL